MHIEKRRKFHEVEGIRTMASHIILIRKTYEDKPAQHDGESIRYLGSGTISVQKAIDGAMEYFFREAGKPFQYVSIYIRETNIHGSGPVLPYATIIESHGGGSCGT